MPEYRAAYAAAEPKRQLPHPCFFVVRCVLSARMGDPVVVLDIWCLGCALRDRRSARSDRPGI